MYKIVNMNTCTWDLPTIAQNEMLLTVLKQTLLCYTIKHDISNKLKSLFMYTKTGMSHILNISTPNLRLLNQNKIEWIVFRSVFFQIF